MNPDERDNPKEMSLSEVLQEQVRAEVRLSRRLAEYKGRWVAVRNHEVVDDAGTLDELVDRVETEEVDAVFAVPTKRISAAFF
jgi:Family of unknown function (DUF5678)